MNESEIECQQDLSLVSGHKTGKREDLSGKACTALKHCFIVYLGG